MTAIEASPPLIADELDLLGDLVPLAGRDIIEIGCGAARLARALLRRHPDSRVTALEVDARQHAENLAMPQPGLHFVAAPAQAVPCAAASFDLALMLKSLHHVPVAEMGLALDEARRVLRPGGLLYISEPVYGGDFSDIVRLYHDERVERAAAQAALDAAVRSGRWTQLAQRWFATSSHFVDFADFARRVVGVTYADYRLDDDTLALVRAAFERHLGPDGAHFLRPMHVRLLRCATRPS